MYLFYHSPALSPCCYLTPSHNSFTVSGARRKVNQQHLIPDLVRLSPMSDFTVFHSDQWITGEMPENLKLLLAVDNRRGRFVYRERQIPINKLIKKNTKIIII